MDALDNMFVPYRDLLAPSAPTAPKTDRSKWIWIGLLIVVAGFCVFLFSRSTVKAAPQLPLPPPPPPVQLQMPAPQPLIAAPKPPIPTTTVKAPMFQNIPQKIDLIRGGEKRSKAESPQELAKQVALAVKEILLEFPDMTAPLVASIVECSVKNILKPQQPQVLQIQTQTTQQVQPTQVKPQRPAGGLMKLQSVEDVPIVEEEEISASGGSKLGKINADSDPNILRRLRERGLDKKN